MGVAVAVAILLPQVVAFVETSRFLGGGVEDVGVIAYCNSFCLGAFACHVRWCPFRWGLHPAVGGCAACFEGGTAFTGARRGRISFGPFRRLRAGVEELDI